MRSIIPELLNLFFILAWMALNLFAIQKCSFTKIMKRNPSVFNAGDELKLKLAYLFRLLIAALGMCIPILILDDGSDLSHNFSLATFSIFMFIGLTSVPKTVLKEQGDNARIIINKPVYSNKATIHLNEAFQSFDKKTYQELLIIIKYAQKYGFGVIEMSSPLFYKKTGELRSFDRLINAIKDKGIQVEHYKTPFFKHWFRSLAMLISQRKSSATTLKNINLMNWRTVVFTISEGNTDRIMPTIPKTLKFISIISVVSILIFSTLYLSGFRLNHSTSYPPGIYQLIDSGKTYTKGDLILFCPPENESVKIAIERRYLEPGLCQSGSEPIIKRIVGQAGDQVTLTDVIKIKGRKLEFAKVLKQDSNNRPLSRMNNQIIPSGYFYVHSEHAPKASYDSRYFGLIKENQIIGHIKEVYIF